MFNLEQQRIYAESSTRLSTVNRQLMRRKLLKLFSTNWKFHFDIFSHSSYLFFLLFLVVDVVPNTVWANIQFAEEQKLFAAHHFVRMSRHFGAITWNGAWSVCVLCPAIVCAVQCNRRRMVQGLAGNVFASKPSEIETYLIIYAKNEAFKLMLSCHNYTYCGAFRIGNSAWVCRQVDERHTY